MRPGRAAFAVGAAAALATVGCAGDSSPPQKPRLELVSTAASTTESSDINTSMKEEFRLEVALTNVGEVPASLGTPEIVNAGFYKGSLRVGLPTFTVAADTDLTPLAKAQTRMLAFVALERNDHRCPLDRNAACEGNPHTDLLEVSATLITESGSWFFRLPIAFTCVVAATGSCP